MNWIDLENFINTLTPEQKEKEISLLNGDNDTLLNIIFAKCAEINIYGTYYGVIEEVEDIDIDDLQDAQQNAYITINIGDPFLIGE